MKIISCKEFDKYWESQLVQDDDVKTENAVKEIIAAVRKDGDESVRAFAARFDKSSPQKLEVPLSEADRALDELRGSDPALVGALELAARNIFSFSLLQKEQFKDFEHEMGKGLFTGQRVIPVQRAAVYAPSGRFPLISSLLMALIPALSAGVEEVFLVSPPMENGLPDRGILAAAGIALAEYLKAADGIARNKLRVFAIGGAQAIAAFAFGTKTVPRADVIAGPGNKFVIAAKRLLYGQVGIDFLAGPSDVLIIADGLSADGNTEKAAEFVAADILAQAEHDPDARSRALVPTREFALNIIAEIEKQITSLPTAETARASLQNGGLIVVYESREEAIRIANIIAPEHLELQTADDDSWIPHLKNYGSLFIGALAAEALGDYSAGVNHTLPTLGNARFTGGLSVRHFLKTVTTLRCAPGEGFEQARQAAEIIARAEGLEAHARSAVIRGG
ncbi:MAG: histidinol dehydrogenase [Treponema sp.]|jgi:histidinol dehydrogenase|nr:histidinol dehydrogenase [Treponema sp.]